jgi:hypothetical protein
MKSISRTHTAGDWNRACDSYGKVRHSRKACVYSVLKTKDGDRLVNIAQRIENWDDARLMAAAKEMYTALKYMNHVEHGYCICPLEDGLRPDSAHSTACADARRALRKAESNHANPNTPQAEHEWMHTTTEVGELLR